MFMVLNRCTIEIYSKYSQYNYSEYNTLMFLSRNLYFLHLNNTKNISEIIGYVSELHDFVQSWASMLGFWL